MFIIKFNNMIRNKWLWGAFAIIVAGAFIVGDTRAPVDTSDNQNINISQTELNLISSVVDTIRIINEAKNPGAVDVSVVGVRNCSVERDTWLSLAAVKAAEEMGIDVSDTEATQIVFEMFRDFNGPDDIRQKTGRTIEQWAYIIKVQETIRRLKDVVQSQLLTVSASEVKLGVDTVTDLFTYVPVYFSNTVVASEIEIPETALEAYYKTHKDSYRKPTQISLRQVIFDSSDFLNSSNLVTEAEIESYYDDHFQSDLITIKGENGNPDTYRSIEEVKDQIIKELSKEASKNAAANKAEDFNQKLLANPNKTMEELAEVEGYTVVTTALFSAKSDNQIVMMNSQDEYLETAFGLLSNDGSEKISTYARHSIDVGQKSYVIAYNSHEPSYVPSFEEVKPVILEKNQKEKAAEIFEEKCKDLKEKLSTGDNFVEIAKANDLVVGTSVTSSINNSLISGTDEERYVVYSISKLEKGAISDPIILPNNTVVFVNVIDRTPLTNNVEKDKIENIIKISNRTEVSSRLWENWLEAKCVEIAGEGLLKQLKANEAQ